ncbi:unnamed protein product, partial [Ixodes pacificus]
IEREREKGADLLVQLADPQVEVGVLVQAQVVHCTLDLVQHVGKRRGAVGARLQRPHVHVNLLLYRHQQSSNSPTCLMARLADKTENHVHLLLEVEDHLRQLLHVRIQLVRLPDETDALRKGDSPIGAWARALEQQRARSTHLFTGPLVRADALDERDGKRVELVGLVRLVHNGQGHAEAHPLEVAHLETHNGRAAHLFGQGDDLGQEVDLQLEHVARAGAGALDGKDASPGPHHARPLVKDGLGVELGAEAVGVALQLLPFHVVLPAFAQDILHPLHVH